MKKVQLDKLTGQQVKALLEKTVENRKIDTIPELLAFLDGVPEGVSLREYITSIAGSAEQVPDNSVGTDQIKDKSITLADLDDRVFATDEDIEQMVAETPES